ncbi:MAG: preprotein translocase subunit YajC [Lachnospiraceae bacterium]
MFLALTGSAGMGLGMTLIYIVVMIAIFYFILIRPQKKEQKEKAELQAALEIGDYVLTTAGFYGEIIDVTDDTVIVEFGNNKNCRIPMQKAAIVQVEKPAKNAEV